MTPLRGFGRTDKAEPKREYDRRDRHEPSIRKSSTVSPLPRRAKDRIDNADLRRRARARTTCADDVHGRRARAEFKIISEKFE